jgi:hypothetical protein
LTSSHFLPNKFYLNFHFFSIDLNILLYHGSRSLLTHFLSFPWPINYNPTFRCNKSSTHSLPIWLKIEDFFFFALKLWCRICPCLMSLKLHKWMKNRL